MRLLYFQSICFFQVCRDLIGTIHGFLEISTSYTVILHCHRIDTRLQHRHILTVGLTTHDTGIHHIKIGVELNDSMFLPERFPTVRHILLIHILRLQVLKLLSIIKMQI